MLRYWQNQIKFRTLRHCKTRCNRHFELSNSQKASFYPIYWPLKAENCWLLSLMFLSCSNLGKTRSNLELYATVKPDVTDISNWVTVKKHRPILYIGPLKQKIAAFYRSLTPIPINMSKTDSKIDKHSMINTVPTITFRETYWPENPVKKKIPRKTRWFFNEIDPPLLWVLVGVKCKCPVKTLTKLLHHNNGFTFKYIKF